LTVDNVNNKPTLNAVPVVVHIVTFNHAETIVPCLNALVESSHGVLGESLWIYLTDNASTDATWQVLQELPVQSGIILRRESKNLGFTGAHNLGLLFLENHNAEYLLLLNPDVAVSRECISRLVTTLELDSSAASAVPKLLRATPDLKPRIPAELDAAGMVVTKECRHFDRGAAELDRGQYDLPEYVFGGTGACLLLRRRAIEDAAYHEPTLRPEKRLFDDSFFAYREDAELAWRLQRLGWNCCYVPSATALHVRRVTPERREILPSEINALGVQNRFLLQLLHLDSGYFSMLPPTLLRNAMVIAACFTVERGSLAGLKRAWELRADSLKKRQWLTTKAKIPGHFVLRWFLETSRRHLRPEIEATNPTASSAASIDIIVINFNSGQRLLRCLQHLAQIELPMPLRIIVVDNGSHDGSASRLEPLFFGIERISFIHSELNLGFAGGIRRAAATSDAELLLLLNPDIELTQESLQKLVECLGKFPSLAGVAPVLIHDDGTPQASFSARLLPRFGAAIAELLLIHRIWPNNPWSSAWRIDREPRIHNYLYATEQDSLPSTSGSDPLACNAVSSRRDGGLTHSLIANTIIVECSS
jgi:GT2 family glycosyltransferase